MPKETASNRSPKVLVMKRVTLGERRLGENSHLGPFEGSGLEEKEEGSSDSFDDSLFLCFFHSTFFLGQEEVRNS